MAGFMRCFKIQIKRFFRRRRSWLGLLFLIPVMALVYHLSLPDQENSLVGIYPGTGEHARNILERLEREEGFFRIVPYESGEDMMRDVESGKLECGFSFAEDFDKRFEKNNMDESILFVRTPFGTKGEVAKEFVLAQVLPEYAESLLLKEQSTFLTTTSEKLQGYFSEKNREYLDSDRTFRTEIFEMERSVDGANGTTRNTNLRGGILGILLFLLLAFTAAGIAGETDGDEGFYRVLTGREKMRFLTAEYCACATVYVAVGWILGILSPDSMGILREGLGMILLAIGTFVAGLALRLIFRKSASARLTVILGLAGIQLLICPILLDLSEWISGIQWIRWIMPVNWYLEMGMKGVIL